MVTLFAALAIAVTAGATAVVVWSRVAAEPTPAAPDRPPDQPPDTDVGAARVRRTRPEEWLRQSGVTLTVGQVGAGAASAGLVTFGVLAWVTRTPVVAVAPAVGAAVLPLLYLAHRRRRRLRSWQAAWPDALRELVAAIAAGRSLGQAVHLLGDTGPEPLRDVFADFPALARVLGIADALEQVKARMADPTSDRVIEVLLVAQERGGAIVRDILEDLVVATTDDLKVLDEIETESLEMRINARAVVVLPWLVLVALTLRPGPFRAFYGSPAGLLVIVVGAVLGSVGAWWLGHLGAQPEEPRVFAGSRSASGAAARPGA